jgi:SpoVK/Ycf46/Vps4 family AAA+-type ATPase
MTASGGGAFDLTTPATSSTSLIRTGPEARAGGAGATGASAGTPTTTATTATATTTGTSSIHVITDGDVDAALSDFTPVSLRGVKLFKGTVEWEDVGGLSAAKRVLKETLEFPITCV